MEFTPKSLIHKNERKYFIAALVMSILTYAVLAVSIIGLFYLALFLGITLFLHALMLGSIRTNGVRLSPEQFPEVYEKVKALCAKMDMTFVPDVYVMESSGALNAFATRFFGRNMVVLYSTMFELIEEGAEDELSFVIAHELAHIKRRHITRQLLVWPAMWMPGITQAYSRACEYTCDRFAAYYTGDSEAAKSCLTILGVGKTLSKKVNRTSYLNQINEEKGFAVWLSEKLATHPPLPKRIHEIGVFMGDAPEDLILTRSSKRLWIWVPASILVIGVLTGGSMYAVDKLSQSLDAFLSGDTYVGGTTPPLVEAVVGGDAETVTELLQAGIDVDEQDASGWTALHWAVRSAEPEMVNMLLQAGADPNLGDFYYVSPLMTAATDGSLDMLQLLIDSDASLDDQDNDGWTALMYAATSGYRDVVEALLAAGANPEITNYQDQTPLMQAVQAGDQEIAELLRNR